MAPPVRKPRASARPPQMAADSTLLAGLRLALSFFTVAPVPVRRVDRRVGGVAICLAPAIGAALGAVVGSAGVGLRVAGASPLLAGVLAVALDTLLTRALHVDGVADTADGLGSYRDRETSLQIMKKSDIGPFGVATVVLTLLLQSAAFAVLLERPALAAIAGCAAAAAAGRAAIGLACRRSIPAARENGLGALVAGTVATPTAIIASLGVAVLAVPAVPGRPWQGPAAIVVGLLGAGLLTRHVVRRLGGITGDTLGAALQVAVTVALVILAIAPSN